MEERERSSVLIPCALKPAGAFARSAILIAAAAFAAVPLGNANSHHGEAPLEAAQRGYEEEPGLQAPAAAQVHQPSFQQAPQGERRRGIR